LRELVVYARDDPDAAHDRVTLSGEEANAVAELLGAPQLVERLARLQEQATGLVSEQLPLAAGSPFVGRRLGETQVRTRTGASIVAVIRAGVATPSPGPEFGLAAGDLVVVVGTRAAIDEVAVVLDGGAVAGAAG
jgi:K+:H+ antiporter subunit KhtT